jgi:hypothetical protein
MRRMILLLSLPLVGCVTEQGHIHQTVLPENPDMPSRATANAMTGAWTARHRCAAARTQSCLRSVQVPCGPEIRYPASEIAK